MATRSQLKNNRGFLTVDFLFGLILVMGLSSILMAFSFTLSVIEGLQYVAFASARAAFASHKTIDDQKALGMKKYEQLLKSTPGLSNLLKKQFFSLSGDIAYHDGDYSPEQDYKNKFYGMLINVEVLYLDFVIPLYGSTAGGNAFKTRITGYLGRESSQDECNQQMQKRWGWILNLNGASYSSQQGLPKSDSVQPGDDNGC